ncbi:MAG: UDP-N-acetylglucosamine 1-carboxyvinyltransferase [Bacteroidales bacterium]|nr:UDP-N-acetylglucosamine 1-carboxyvinyltransferase [Bacteroidales bacterium]
MSRFVIEGGYHLEGTFQPRGAKNEALQVLCATLLTDEDVIIHNLPDILDVKNLIRILELLGVEVEPLSNKGSYRFNARNVTVEKFQSLLCEKKISLLRGSILIAGPLLARFGLAIINKPGGDKIGRRRLDTHIHGFIKLGANVEVDNYKNVITFRSDRLRGTYILLEEASVTGTANLIMASVLAEGTTTIYNAACEPYIQQLCKMLVNMGAKIHGIGSNLLTIHGVSSLHGTDHTLLPDMIEVGSFIGLAAMTQSNLILKNVCLPQLGQIPDVFKKLGIKILMQGDDIVVPYQDVYEIQTPYDGSILTISDAPWPGFTPDLLSVVLVVASQARGSVMVHQKMFESRLFFVDNLIEMGAKIILCDPHRATVIGLERKYPLRGIEMSSPDIRAGISMLIAALSARGKSIIHNVHQIDRGYERIELVLQQLGAKIKREEEY